jgi:energy-coupling factor transport system ATP-binding protein
VLLSEHRLERCLPAADRVVALEHGAVVCDGPPDAFLEWAAAERPALATPAARLFSLAGLRPMPASVKHAREALRGTDLTPPVGAYVSDTHTPVRDGDRAAPRRGLSSRLRRNARPAAAAELRGVWLELADGPVLLRGVDLRLEAGERVALMGRNGAGKSTLLRCLKGLAQATRGSVVLGGEVALLLQNPGDYLIHEHVADEAPPAALARAGLSERAAASPRDLSGGERQRLALEIVLAGSEPAVVCLDEPTRGMDGAHRSALVARLESLSRAGAAVVVATHDTELAAELADRVVLMGEGVVLADGQPGELLAGGRHFATDVARILDGAGEALTPEQGARLLRRELVP